MSDLVLTPDHLAQMDTLDRNIRIKYVNNTRQTDFQVLVFSKNFSTDNPTGIYFAAWEVLRTQSSVTFEYPIRCEVGVSYEDGGKLVVSGPFHADLGSTWDITQELPTDVAVLSEGETKIVSFGIIIYGKKKLLCTY